MREGDVNFLPGSLQPCLVLMPQTNNRINVCDLNQGLAKMFSMNGQIIHIPGLVRQTDSIATTHLGNCSPGK